MKKVLNILSALDSGGVETMITNYYYHFPKNDIIFDFAVHEEKVGLLENNLRKYGSKIIHLTPKHKGILKNFKELWNLINKADYDAVYCHQNFSSFLPLIVAKFKGIKVRIVHSHGINEIKGIYGFISKLLIKLNATHFFSCSEEASRCLFGKKWNELYPNRVMIRNAIDVKKFKFSKYNREILRKKLNINDRICILHVGRFTPEKNHKFLIDIMSKLSYNNYCLVLIGEGNLKDEIQKYADSKNLKNIIFLDPINDIEKYYSMADLFLFPSVAEGFGIVSLEAQANCLPVLASNNIPKNTNFGLIEYIPLDSLDIWVDKISKTNRDMLKYPIVLKNILDKGFDIETESVKLYELLDLIMGDK